MIRVLVETYSDKEIDELDTDKQMTITDDENRIIVDNSFCKYAYLKNNIKKITIEVE